MKKVNVEKLSSMMEQQEVYGPPSYNSNNQLRNSNSSMIEQQAVYGPPSYTEENNGALTGVNIGIIIVLFILGVIALVNKKLSKKAKIIIITSLIIIAIITTVIIEYFLTA